MLVLILCFLVILNSLIVVEYAALLMVAKVRPEREHPLLIRAQLG
jgi:hypothetical protein